MEVKQLKLLENNTQMCWLLDFYGGMLTDKQQEILSLYYEEDYSLTEISDIFNVSRQNIYDIIYRASNNLKKYEQKLSLVERTLNARDKLQKAQNLLKLLQKDINSKNIAEIEYNIAKAIKLFEGE
ncbi:MAG: DNA-binding protein [Christensenellaceae bacterium]|nr:DNA-binding protein [Christensenellaceae bacterium]